MKNYYEVLGLSEGVDRDTVMRRYKELLERSRDNSTRLSEITEAYYLILVDLGKQKDDVKYVLQRQEVRAKIDVPLKLNGVKKVVVGVLATVMLGALSSCEASYEVGNYTSGYTYIDEEKKLGQIEYTDDYDLVRIDGNIYLAKHIETTYGVCSVMRYYDVTMSGQESNCLGVVLITRDWKTNYYDDSDYFAGSYGLNKILPEGSVVSLSKFVSSSKPSQEDIDFWSSNSLKVHEAFDDLILNDLVIYGTESGGDKGEKRNPLTCFICINDAGEEITLVGYRASGFEDAIGYNYFYNVLDGSIYYVGKYTNEAFVTVVEEDIEEGKSLGELKELYGKQENVVTIEKEQPGKNTVLPSEQLSSDENPQVSESEQDTQDELGEGTELEAAQTQNISKLKCYKDILVIDLSTVKENTIQGYEPLDFLSLGLKYLFIYPTDIGNSYNLVFNNQFYLEHVIMTQHALSFNINNYDFFSNDSESINESVYTLDDFLKNMDLAQYVNDSYTLGELSQIEQAFNIRDIKKSALSDILVIDLGENTDYARYVLVRKIDDGTYYNISNDAFWVFNGKTMDGLYNPLVKSRLLNGTAMYLKDFIDTYEESLSSQVLSLQEEYSDVELALLQDAINGYDNRKLREDLEKVVNGRSISLTN